MRSLCSRHVLALAVVAGGVALAGCGQEPVQVVKNRPPLAVAGADVAVQRGAPVSFDGSASSDPDGSIASLSWDFGDGVGGDGALASHIYNAGGAYTVTLTVKDDDGAAATDSLVVTVDDNEPPVAVVTVTPETAAAGQSVRFDGSGSSDADGVIATYDWDFGDGEAGAGPVFDHAFAAGGSYDVVLTVHDDRGAEASATLTYIVTDTVDYGGQWSWTLVDPTQRDGGLVCGTFEDSMLDILTSPPQITVTESAGSTSLTYAGSLADTHFDVSNTQFGIVQEIVADFDSPTSFTGVYKIDPGFGSGCDDRAVVGTKVSN